MKKSRQLRNRKGSDTEPPAPAVPQSKLRHVLDIPASAVTGLCQMELSGNREAVIEGCTGILEYNDAAIHLATSKMSIRFTGRGLQVKVMTHSSAVIEGWITGIEFVT